MPLAPYNNLLALVSLPLLFFLHGCHANVHTLRFATYDTSSKLGPWAPAVLNTNWQQDGNITTPVWCLQNNAITKEAVDGQVGQADDCLLLRVFTPNNVTSSSQLPVLLWIHGGIYLLGSGVSEDLYYGEGLAIQQNMIVVCINYRLGAHGFLGYKGAYGDTVNAGTLDQRVAIEWTYKYIAEFGGDPSKITLAGESAGATSTNIHMANPSTNRMLRSAILESNPAGINLKPASEQANLFRRLAETAGCSAEEGCGENPTDEDLMDCLVLKAQTTEGMKQIIKESSAVTYTNSVLQFDIWMTFYTWAPSIDDYVTGQPNKEVLKHWPSDKPVLIGTNEEEGRFFISLICTILTGIGDALPLGLGGALIQCEGADFPLRDKALYKSLLLLAYGIDSLGADIYYPYQKNVEDERTNDALEQATTSITDELFNCPNYDMAMAVSPGKTYYYRFAFDSICSVSSVTEDCVGFTCHGDEIATLFGTWGVKSVAELGGCTDEKVAQLQPFVDLIQQEWGHFVREGKPDPIVAWNPADSAVDNMLIFEDLPNVVLPTAFETEFYTHHVRQETCNAQRVCRFWDRHTARTQVDSYEEDRLRQRQ